MKIDQWRCLHGPHTAHCKSKTKTNISNEHRKQILKNWPVWILHMKFPPMDKCWCHNSTTHQDTPESRALFHTRFIQGSGMCYSFNSNNYSHDWPQVKHPWKPESDWANKAGYNYGLTTAWWVHFLHLAAQIKLRIHRGTSPHGKEGSAICSRAHTYTHTRSTAATDLWLQWLHNILKVDLLLSDTSGYLWGQEPVFENNIWNVNQSDECMLRFLFVCFCFFHFQVELL